MAAPVQHIDHVANIQWSNVILMLLGLYMAAGGIGGLLTPGRWRDVIAELEASPTLTFYGGIIALLLGAAIALAGPGSWPLWLGLAAMLKGVILLVNPPGIFAFYRRIITPGNGRAISLVMLVAGIALIALPLL